MDGSDGIPNSTFYLHLSMMERFFRLSKAEYFADFFITVPITLASIVLSLADFSALWVALFLAGLLTWTLYEYLIHRFVLHRLWPFRDVHNLHHHAQRDFIGTHPAITLTIYVVLWLSFGGGVSSAAMVGFSVGYVIYSTIHTLFHYTAMSGTLKRHHAIHHHFDNVNFGVSTRFWDKIFRTEF